jgi:hypothetical protein
LPEKQEKKKVEKANLSTQARKKKTPSPSPAYVPSEYELKAAKKRKEITEYIVKKFPKENKQVT